VYRAKFNNKMLSHIIATKCVFVNRSHFSILCCLDR